MLKLAVYGVYNDAQRRTCLQVYRTSSQVTFVPMDAAGLEVVVKPAESFDAQYKPLTGYSVEQAAKIYVAHSQLAGATPDAMNFLSQIIHVTDEELDMAVKKNRGKEKVVVAPDETEGTPLKEPRKRTVKKNQKVEQPKEKSLAKVKKSIEGKSKRPSAAQMFQDLILQGGLTDDQIFERVQAEFGLDDKKRGYVKWYRNHLIKQGKLPKEK